MKKRKLFLSLGLMSLCFTFLVSCGNDKITTKDVEEAPVDVLSEYVEELPKVNTATSTFTLVNSLIASYQSVNGASWAATQTTPTGSNLFNLATQKVICPITADTVVQASNGFVVVIERSTSTTDPSYSYKVYAPTSNDSVLTYVDKVGTSYEISMVWNDEYDDTNDVTHDLIAYSISLSSGVKAIYKDINSKTKEVSYVTNNPMKVSKLPGYSELDEVSGNSSNSELDGIYVREDFMVDQHTMRMEFVDEAGKAISSIDLDATRLSGVYIISSTLIYQYADQIDSEATKYDFYQIESNECEKFNLTTYKFDIKTGKNKEIKLDCLLSMGLRLASSHNNNSEYKPCNYYPIRDGKVDKASYNTGLFDKEGKLVYKVTKLNLEKTYKLSNGNFLSKSFKNSSYNLYSKDLELLATEVTPDETYTLFRNDNCQYFDISGKNILNPAKANALGNNLIQMDATIYEIAAGSSIKEFIATKGTTIFTINREQWVDECSDVSDTEALTPTYKHIIRKIGTSFTFTFYSKDSDINIYREFNNEAVSIYIPSYPYLYTDKECLLQVAYFGLK